MKRHGESWSNRTPEYSAWNMMRQRCLNPRAEGYENYGGRGITIDTRWSSYENFLEDMGRRPGPSYSLDRKNNELGYSKENCRWATKKEQQNNTRSTVLLTFRGEALSRTAWAERYGMDPDTLAYRLKRGWSMEKALTTSRELHRGQNC